MPGAASARQKSASAKDLTPWGLPSSICRPVRKKSRGYYPPPLSEGGVEKSLPKHFLSMYSCQQSIQSRTVSELSQFINLFFVQFTGLSTLNPAAEIVLVITMVIIDATGPAICMVHSSTVKWVFLLRSTV